MRRRWLGLAVGFVGWLGCVAMPAGDPADTEALHAALGTTLAELDRCGGFGDATARQKALEFWNGAKANLDVLIEQPGLLPAVDDAFRDSCDATLFELIAQHQGKPEAGWGAQTALAAPAPGATRAAAPDGGTGQ